MFFSVNIMVDEVSRLEAGHLDSAFIPPGSLDSQVDLGKSFNLVIL